MHNLIFQRIESKLQEKIISTNIINKDYISNIVRYNPPQYLYYPYLFADIFDITDTETLDELSIAGFLYYVSILNFDILQDTEDKNLIPGFSNIIAVNHLLIDETLRILCRIFPADSDFWTYWNLRRKQFFDSIKKEKDLISNYSIDLYNDIAIGKAAFAKVAIDSCFILSKKSDKATLHKDILQSHDKYSIAYQMTDDVSDIRKDKINKQFNLVQYTVSNNTNKKNLEVEDIYLTKEIKNVLLESKYLIVDAIQDIKLKCNWIKVLKVKEKEIDSKIDSIDIFQKINFAQNQLSNNYIIHSWSDDKLTKAIDLSINFLINRRNKETGIWEEYITQAGISTYWSTSFVLNAILPIYSNFETQNSIDYIKNKIGLWGYSDKWNVEDSDSSNFAMSVLLKNNTLADEKIDLWLKFQKEDGGFATFNELTILENSLREEKFKAFEGWLTSHTCVSAVSLGLLKSVKNKYNTEFNRLINYAEHTNIDNAYWNSYWWTSPIYATYFFYQNLSEIGNRKFIGNTIDWLYSIQNNNGSFSDNYNESLFYSALALKIFIGGGQKGNVKVEKLFDYIISNQFDDGSWKESHALRLPSPDTISPDSSLFSEVKTFGVNIRSREFQRIFTTSICTNALVSYKLNKNILL